MCNDAWLAGLFEGEGHLGPSTNVQGKIASYSWSIKMTDLDIMERVRDVVGIDRPLRLNKRAKEHYKDQWEYRLHARDDVRHVVQRLLPFMGERRAERMREFLTWDAENPPRTYQPRETEGITGTCKNGHPYDVWRVTKKGARHRHCTTCANEGHMRWYYAKRAAQAS